ncbi:MAG: class B sortase [Ruminococcus sp.]|nr:class B sortase [Ruminococcus sp.]MBR2284620.1 class B sortase [Ruminococcus sp.]
MKKAVLLCAIAAFAAAGCYCAYRYYQSDVLPEQQLDKANEEQLQLFENVKPDYTIPDDKPGTTKPQENLLEAAEEVNSGVVAWLTIPGTHIDYPICQAEDNDFYLHNGFDGQYNYELGCPFLDYRCAGDFSGFNSIVYAHHMTEQRMFADIALYIDESFFDGHDTGYLVLGDDVHAVDFFAYLSVPSTAPAYHAVFVMDSEKQEYIDYIFQTAKYSKEINIDENSHLLLLSTCTFEYEEARGVLVGVIQ